MKNEEFKLEEGIINHLKSIGYENPISKPEISKLLLNPEIKDLFIFIKENVGNENVCGIEERIIWKEMEDSVTIDQLHLMALEHKDKQFSREIGLNLADQDHDIKYINGI